MPAGPGRERGRVLPRGPLAACMVHFYRNVFSHVPAGKLREVALMLKAIHAQEDLAGGPAQGGRGRGSAPQT